ncbi:MULTISPECIES: hypothetical protein [unclassified Myroides]|uniref:hypothetical protein n=1 Tax=unclassified Myroides TaxID=2642485 RepID=UPI003D2F7D8B
MEILYVIIALHAENKQAFTDELKILFPFASIELVDFQQESLLLVTINIDEICWTNFDVSVLFLDEKTAVFSRKHPYLKVGVISKIGQWNTFFYDGYILKNKQVVFEHGGLYDGYVPLLKQLLTNGEDFSDSVFDSFFSRR